MALPKVDKSKIIEVVDELSDDSLHQLVMFLDYLRFKEQSDHNPSWFKQAFDVFAPVRADVTASGMTDDEINKLIDEAIDEVRRDGETYILTR